MSDTEDSDVDSEILLDDKEEKEESDVESIESENELEDITSEDESIEEDEDEIIDQEYKVEDIKKYKSSLISDEEYNNFYELYDISNNITENILSKYEKTKILSERAEQLSCGGIPLVQNYKDFKNTLEIAEEELKNNKIPFIIKRTMNDKNEYWKLEDLIIN